MNWPSQIHHLYQQLKIEALEGKKLLFLYSGGIDSTALFASLCELQGPLKFSFEVLHFHHGGESEFRSRAFELCKKNASEKRVPFHFLRSENSLLAEAEMREFRLQGALDFFSKGSFDFLLTAHHQEDLLETRVLRLIRGTGLQGLRSMQAKEGPWWRPLLGASKKSLQEIVEWSGLAWAEDPSNLENQYQRNWVRNELFPLIETRSLKSLAHLAEFLSQAVDLYESFQDQFDTESWREKGIPRPWLMTLSEFSQKQVVAKYLWSLGVRDYGHTHIDEIRKHLDKCQSHHTFNAASCLWKLCPGYVLAVPREVVPGKIHA